jgi:hypothetical protein
MSVEEAAILTSPRFTDSTLWVNLRSRQRERSAQNSDSHLLDEMSLFAKIVRVEILVRKL